MFTYCVLYFLYFENYFLKNSQNKKDMSAFRENI